MRVRDAKTTDFPAIQGVARLTWEDTYRGIVPERERADFVERAYSDESLRRRAVEGVFLVAEEDGGVVGFADFLSVPGGPGLIELAALYVLPAAQGRGIGTRLLDAGVGRFAPAKTLTLHVARDNLVGRRFYEARGFRVVGEHVWRLSDREVVELEMVREIGATGEGSRGSASGSPPA